MKSKIVLIFLIFICFQNSYSWEGIGVNIGGGGYRYILSDTPPCVSDQGLSSLFAIDIPLVESHLLEIEFGLIYYWVDVDEKMEEFMASFYDCRIYLFYCLIQIIKVILDA